MVVFPQCLSPSSALCLLSWVTCPQLETCVFRGTPGREVLAQQPQAQGQYRWVAWGNPALPRAVCCKGACPTSPVAFQIQQKGVRCFLKSFSYFLSGSCSPSAGTSNQEQGLSLGRHRRSSAWSGCSFVQAGHPAALRFLPLVRIRDTPCLHALPLPFLAFHFPLYFRPSSLPFSLACL